MLKPLSMHGHVAAVLINPDRKQSLASQRIDRVQATFAGLEGDAHGGLTRRSCSRVALLYPRGTPIRNTRQVSILSEEELATIAADMGIARLEPEWVGANLVLSGIPNLTRLPPSSRLQFPSGASLVVDMENRPCKFPGEVVDRHFPGLGQRFPSAAVGRRGVTGWVEREGIIAVADEVTVYIPVQPPYPHLPEI